MTRRPRTAEITKEDTSVSARVVTNTNKAIHSVVKVSTSWLLTLKLTNCGGIINLGCPQLDFMHDSIAYTYIVKSVAKTACVQRARRNA